MRLFRRKPRISLSSRALPILDRWIVPVGLRFQGWAEPLLIRIERQLSRRQKILLVTIFCLIAGGYSTTVLVAAFSGAPAQPPGYLSPASISRPMAIPHNDSMLLFHRKPVLRETIPYQSPIKK